MSNFQSKCHSVHKIWCKTQKGDATAVNAYPSWETQDLAANILKKRKRTIKDKVQTKATLCLQISKICILMTNLYVHISLPDGTIKIKHTKPTNVWDKYGSLTKIVKNSRKAIHFRVSLWYRGYTCMYKYYQEFQQGNCCHGSNSSNWS